MNMIKYVILINGLYYTKLQASEIYYSDKMYDAKQFTNLEFALRESRKLEPEIGIGNSWEVEIKTIVGHFND